MKRFFTMLPAAATALALSYGANAQTTSMPPARDCTNITAQAAAHLSYLQNKLQITSAEQSAWNAFAAAVTSGAQSVAAACAALPNPAPTDAPTRFADHLSLAAAHVQAGQTVLPALKALYATLSAQQQAAFDAAAKHHRGIGQH